MFRFAILVLAAIGLGSLLFGGAGFAAGAGFLLLAPLLFLAKIMFFVMIFGLFKHGFGHYRRPSANGPWGRRPRRESTRDRVPSEEERFADWHRLQHARDEVDSWVDPEL